MPQLRLKATGALEDIPDSAITDALATGLYEPPGADVQVPVVVDGYTGQVSGQDLGVYTRDLGARPETEGEFRARETAARIEREHGGALGEAAAFTEGALDAATFGGFGAVTDTIWGGDYTEARRERADANPVASGLGTAGGLLAPAILSGGTGAAGALARATPAGAASRLGARIAEGGGVARAAAGYATEGALYGAGHVLSETILRDKELSAEAFLAGAGEGAALGGLGGVGISLLGRGAKAAKRQVDSLTADRALASLEAEQRTALKEAEKAQRAAEKIRIEQQRHANRLELEASRQKGRIEAIGARGEVASVGAEARVAVAGERTAAEIAKAEAQAAIAKAKAQEATEALAVERAKYDRARMVMDGRIQLSETYTAGWRGAGESREAVAATKLEAAELGADAKLRTGLAGALAKSGRQDAGFVIEELIPAKLRTKAALESSKGEVLNQVAQLSASTDDLVRQADELLALNPGAYPELQALRDRAAQASPAANEWAAKMSGSKAFQLEHLDDLQAAGFTPPAPPSAPPGAPPSAPAAPPPATPPPKKPPAPIGEPLPVKTIPTGHSWFAVPNGPQPTSLTPVARKAGGSQGGKWMVDENGQQWFTKTYRGSSDRLASEHLANRLYRDMGIAAPETHVSVVDGKPMLMSKELDGTPTGVAGLKESDLRDGFVVDAWLGNWDVLGQTLDNALVDGGKAYRIDNGGSLVWRAQGARKVFEETVSELDSMRQAGNSAGRVFGDISDEQLLGMLDDFEQRYAAIDQDLGQRVSEVFRHVDAEDIDLEMTIAQMLRARADWLRTEGRAMLQKRVAGKPYTSMKTAYTPISRDEANQAFAAVTEGATREMRDAALIYSGKSYRKIGEFLRGAGDPSEVVGNMKVSDAVRHLDELVESSSTPRGVLVYRGLAGENLPRFEIGEVVSDPSFWSTSTSATIAKRRFGKSLGPQGEKPSEFALMHIDVPQDSRAAYISAFAGGGAEGELLLPRNTAVRVLARSVDDEGIVHAHVELVTSSQAKPAGLDGVGGAPPTSAAGPPSEFAEGLETVRSIEQAHHDLAQAIRPHLDDVTGMSLDDALAGMDEAITKQDDILTDAIARNAEATSAGAAPPPPEAPGPLPAMPPMPGATSIRPTASGATSALGVLDLAASLGGLPNANDIPVVGPLLGTYLKYRAVAGALGKVGIRVGGPVARIARTAAGAQDRASAAVALLVRGADKAAPTARRASTPLTATLARPLWDPDDDEAPPPRKAVPTGPAKPARKDPQELFRKRQEELLIATADPAETKREIAASIPAPPALASAIADAMMRRFDFLAGVMPQDPRPPTLRPRPYQHPIADLSRFADAVRAVSDPVGAVLEHAVHGSVTPVMAEALRVVYPRLYAQIHEELVEQVATSPKPISHERRSRLALVFDVPLDGTMTPEYRSARQQEYAAAAQAAPPAGGPQLKLSAQEELGPVRRAMR